MSWSECLYQYHKKYGGQLLAGGDEDALLVLTWKDRPLAVDLSHYVSSGRGGVSSAYFVRARVPVTLGKPYKLTVGAEKKLSGGVNAVLKMVPEVAGFSADFGYPEVTKKRLIRSNNHSFTKLVLGNLEFRNALAACPEEKLELRPGPGEEGLHLITVTTASAIGGGVFDGGAGWYLADDYDTFNADSEMEAARAAQEIEKEFFPRMDRLLDLCRAAWNAVTQWPM